MNHDDHDQARADIRQRQHEICNRVFAAAGDANVKMRELNAALIAAGLPALPREVNEEQIINGRTVDPLLHAMLLEEFGRIIDQAPGDHRGRTVREALKALCMTMAEAEALEQKRVRERLGWRAS
jgi:hypothetical protein